MVRRKEREEGDGSEDFAGETRVEEMRAVEEATEAIDDNTSSLCYFRGYKTLISVCVCVCLKSQRPLFGDKRKRPQNSKRRRLKRSRC